MLRIIFAIMVALHGLIHLMGFAKAFGYAELPQLTQPISRPSGTLWLAAALLCLATVAALFLTPRWWWLLGALALVASQSAIVISWSDAKFGTLANIVLLIGLLCGFVSRGPLSLRSEFEHDLGRVQPATSQEVLTEADLAALPDPVQRYVRRSGAIGQPRVHNFRATWTGRIRSDVESQWMHFTAEQLNTFEPPQRFFMMNATMKGLPVDVLHAFDAGGATMRVKRLSVISKVDLKGPDLTRAETVTLFNDMCFFAPGALISAAIAWEPVASHTTKARYTQGANTISAELTFNDAGELIDFGSDDRSMGSTEGRTLTRMRWTTPVRDYAQVGPARVATKAHVLWHPHSGAWSYGEFELTSLAYNVRP